MSLVTLKQGSWIQFHIATKATWTQYSHVGPELLKMVKRAWEGSTDEYLRPVCSWESLCNYCSSASNYTDCKQFLLEDISTLHFYCLRTETLPPFLQLYKETWAINCFTTQFKVGEDFRYKLKDHPWMQWKTQSWSYFHNSLWWSYPFSQFGPSKMFQLWNKVQIYSRCFLFPNQIHPAFWRSSLPRFYFQWFTSFVCHQHFHRGHNFSPAHKDTHFDANQ